MKEEVTIKIKPEMALIEILNQIYDCFEFSVNGEYRTLDPLYLSSIIREVQLYKCPVCNYRVAKIELDTIKAPIDKILCRCRAKYWSEYIPLI